MLVKFTQQVDLPARLAEERIAEYFELDRNQVRCRYVNRKMPTDQGEKILEVRVDEPLISNADMLVALGITQKQEREKESTSQSVNVRTIYVTNERKEPAMAEEKSTSAEQVAQQKQFASFIEMMKNVLGLDKVVEWLKAQVLELIDSARKTVAEYEIKVKEQDKKISDLIEAKNENEKLQVKIKSDEETRYNRLSDRLKTLETKVANSGNAVDALGKALKGQ